jgi:hypothetical protein
VNERWFLMGLPFFYYSCKKKMRKLILILSITCSFSVAGQFQEKTSFVDGTASFSSFHRNDPINGDRASALVRSSFSFGTSVSEKSFFFFGVQSEGLNLISSFRDFSNNGAVTFYEFTTSENIYSVSLGFEKFLKLNERLFFVSLWSGSFGLGKGFSEWSDDLNSKVENDLTNFSVGVSPRLQYFIDNKWAVTGSIGSFNLTRRISKNKGSSDKIKETQFNSGFGLNTFGLGIRLYLNNSAE